MSESRTFPTRALMTALLLGCVALPATGHTAALINNAIIPGINEFEDSDAERVARSDGQGGTTFVTSGNLQVGDVIQTALRFNTANSTQIFLVPGLAAPYQLTAYSELRVAAIFDPGTTNPCAGTTCDIIMAPTGNLGVNVLAAVYENPLGTLNNLGDAPATGIAKAQSGSLVATLGFGDVDDFWILQSSIIDLGLAASLPPGSSQVPNGVFGLSVLSDPGAVPFSPNGIISPIDGNFHDLVGNLSAFERGPGVNAGWLLSTNTTVDFFVAVPEPGSLALLGLTLLCMGAVTKRRGRKL